MHLHSWLIFEISLWPVPSMLYCVFQLKKRTWLVNLSISNPSQFVALPLRTEEREVGKQKQSENKVADTKFFFFFFLNIDNFKFLFDELHRKLAYAVQKKNPDRLHATNLSLALYLYIFLPPTCISPLRFSKLDGYGSVIERILTLFY